MTFYVYVLKSIEGYRYIGMSENVNKRLEQHNNKLVQSTKHGRNWNIIHIEKYSTRSAAVRRERWFKTGVGRDWLRKNIPDWE